MAIPDDPLIALDVKVGDIVTKHQRFLTLEAIKMEHALEAPFDSRIEEVTVALGSRVSEGTTLITIHDKAE